MAGTAIARSATLNSDPAPAKKKRSNNARKPLAQKNAVNDESNVQPSPAKAIDSIPAKEVIAEVQPSPKVAKQTKASKKSKQTESSSFEKDLLEMREKLEQLRLEKEKTEDLLKEKDEILKTKEEELEARGKNQEKLEVELKKLQKLKEFKPTLNFPMAHQSKDHNSKKKKGGSEIKRPSAPYILWSKDHWAEVKKENPDADFKEMSTILGAKWKTVSAEEKKPYEEQYQAEKEGYLKIVAKEKREKAAMKLFEEENKQKTAIEFYEQYMQFLQDAADTGNKKAKKEKDPLKPKKPMLAYFIYSNERRPALMAQSKSMLEISKITGEEWKSMSDKKKKPYEEMAKKNKEKYLQEMEEYTRKKTEDELNQKMEEEEMMKIQKQEALQLLKKKEKAENIIKKTKVDKQKKKQVKEGKVEADPNKPKKPASSYILFSKETRKALQEERPGVNFATLNALISVKWKEISDEEKKKWNDKAALAMNAYKKEMEEYNRTTTTAASSANEG